MDAFGQFLALGGEQLQAFLRIACGLVVVREQGVHERGADDDAVLFWAGTIALIPSYTAKRDDRWSPRLPNYG